MQTRVWGDELFLQLRDGRFVPYLEWIEARRRDPLEELRRGHRVDELGAGDEVRKDSAPDAPERQHARPDESPAAAGGA